MRSGAALLATALGLFAVVGLTTRTSPESVIEDPAPPLTSVEASLWSVLSPHAGTPRVDDAVLARRVARLGKAVIQPAIAVFIGNMQAPEQDYEVDGRTIEARPRVLLTALRLLPREAVFQEIDAVTHSNADVNRRLLLARILAAMGGKDALRRILEIVTELDPIQWERRIFQAQVQELIGRTVRDDRNLAREVATLVRSVEIPLAMILTSAVAEAGAWQATPQLAAAFGRDQRLDLALAGALSKLGSKAAGSMPESALDSLRAQLDGQDPRVVCAVASALGRMGDEVCASRLAQLLDDPQPLLRPGIPSALATLCGIELPADRKTWEEWLGREKSWSLERLPELQAACAGSDVTRIPSAVSELRAHKLFRHRAALALVPMLGSENPGLVQLACEVLPDFGSGAVLPALRPLLQSDVADVRIVAAAAVQALTGEVVPSSGKAKPSGF